MTKLDKSRPYGTLCGGNTGGTYHQDGNIFRADGSIVGNDPNPEAPVAESSAVSQPVAEAPPPVVVTEDTPTQEPATEDTRAQLDAMHPSKLKKLMEMRRLEVVKGAGSKAKNIEILLAND